MSQRVSFPSVAQGKHIEEIMQLGPSLTAPHCFGILTTHYFSGESNEKRF